MKFLNEIDNQNIINLGRQIQNIVGMNHYDIEFRFDKGFYHRWVEGEEDHTIGISELPFIAGRTFESVCYYGLYQYFKIMNIPNNLYPYAIYIHFILHELGHASQINLFNYDPYLFLISDSVDLMINSTYLNQSNAKVIYNNGYNEVYADRFAYQWFPIVWNSVSSLIPKEFIDMEIEKINPMKSNILVYSKGTINND